MYALVLVEIGGTIRSLPSGKCLQLESPSDAAAETQELILCTLVPAHKILVLTGTELQM